ncbi:MAG: serine/threonine protein kinase, partial [Myxococcales bacterium]
MTEPLPASVDDPLGLLGSTIGEKYVIERFVAEGGFSLLYRAQHTIWKQPVAVKFLKAMASAPPDQRQGLLDSFVQEGQLLRQLSSRTASILQAHDVGTWMGPAGEWYPYLILEWLDGKPLDQVLDERRDAGDPPLTLPQILAHFESVARALEVVHRRGVAHRDIKPANLFVVGDMHGEDAFVKVLDFGIAKVLGDMAERSAATARTGSAISSFTPWYGAPEQFSKHHGATGPWTDVFALALVMVEMLTLRPPLEGDELVPLALQSADPVVRPTPRQRGVAVSDEVEAVFARALAVNPSARYSTLGPFWNDLCQAAGAEQYVDQATQSLEVPRLSLLRSAGLDPSALLGGAGTVPVSALAEQGRRVEAG